MVAHSVLHLCLRSSEYILQNCFALRLMLTSHLQSEMVISNIGTIVGALPATASDQATTNGIDNTPQQVRLISIANTMTRILVGPLADYVSPVASCLPNGTIAHARKHRISRVSFLVLSAVLLTLTFLWTSFGITTQDRLWILRLACSL